jgi:hypothetical protein
MDHDHDSTLEILRNISAIDKFMADISDIVAAPWRVETPPKTSADHGFFVLKHEKTDKLSLMCSVSSFFYPGQKTGFWNVKATLKEAKGDFVIDPFVFAANLPRLERKHRDLLVMAMKWASDYIDDLVRTGEFDA